MTTTATTDQSQAQAASASTSTSTQKDTATTRRKTGEPPTPRRLDDPRNDHPYPEEQRPKDEKTKKTKEKDSLEYIRYDPAHENEYVASMRQLISKDLSEPYSIYVYRYFLYQWGDLCFMAVDNNYDHDHGHHAMEGDGKEEEDKGTQKQRQQRKQNLVGVVVSKLEPHRGGPLRGYIAMLAVREEYRGRGIATKLVQMAIDAMIERDADEVALETEVTNTAAMKLYERLGFLRSKRLHRYYLNGNSAFRLVLYLKEGVASIPTGFDPSGPLPAPTHYPVGEEHCHDNESFYGGNHSFMTAGQAQLHGEEQGHGQSHEWSGTVALPSATGGQHSHSHSLSAS